MSEEILLVDVRVLARLLHLGRATIWRQLATGRLPAPVRIGRSVRWRKAEIEAWIEAGCPERAKWDTLKNSA